MVGAPPVVGAFHVRPIVEPLVVAARLVGVPGTPVVVDVKYSVIAAAVDAWPSGARPHASSIVRSRL